MQNAIIQNFVQDGHLIRTLHDEIVDISLLAVAIPFRIFDVNDRIVTETVKRVEEHLKLSNGGYARYQWDTYIGGNAWIIASLWLAIYYIEKENKARARELFDWVTSHSDTLGFLPEQIEQGGNETAWVKQLSWSHAMYIIVKAKLEE